MFIIPQDFYRFVSSDCNRMTFITDYLNKAGIEAPVIQINNKNHIYVKFPLSQYNPMFPIKTVIAHYDRFPGSPGANDNSSGVYALLMWAERLAKRPGFHNIRLVFTDGEEMGEEGVNQQGAYDLAVLFKRLGITKESVFVFDSVGRGTIPVICDTHLPKGVSRTFITDYNKLLERAEKVLRRSCGKWFCLPADYSDNAGFIVNGIPAVTITMLPSNEAELYVRDKNQTPYTWKLFHTVNDNPESLTPASFDVMEKILDELASLV